MVDPVATAATTVDWSSVLAGALLTNGVTCVGQVPDEVTGPLLGLLAADQDCRVVDATREEEAVGILAGFALAGHRTALVVQASGIGNAVNVLGSLCVPCGIPTLLLVSERGGLHEFNPCQVPLGSATVDVLSAIGVPSFRLERVEEVDDVVRGAATLAFSTQRPVALIVTTTMTGGRS